MAGELYPAISIIRVSCESDPPTVTTTHVNVFHFAKRDRSLVTDADCLALATRFNTRLFLPYRALFYTDQVFKNFLFQGVYGDPKPTYEDTAWAGQTGSRVIDGDPLPAFNSHMIRWHTGGGSRRFQGRTWLGGLREQESDGNYIASGGAYDLAVVAFAGAMSHFYQASLSEPNWVMVVLSDPDAVLPDDPAPAGKRNAQGRGVIGMSQDMQIRTLRRRMIGVGA